MINYRESKQIKINQRERLTGQGLGESKGEAL